MGNATGIVGPVTPQAPWRRALAVVMSVVMAVSLMPLPGYGGMAHADEAEGTAEAGALLQEGAELEEAPISTQGGFASPLGATGGSGADGGAESSDDIIAGVDGSEDEGGSSLDFAIEKSDVSYDSLQSAITAASAGQTVLINKAGDYTLPSIPNNITIKGAVDGVQFKHTSEGNIASISNGATFVGVSFEFGNVNYHGFEHAGKIVMRNCVLNGRLTSYGDMEFESCTFNAESSDYSMWVYGGHVFSYKDCTFYNAGKSKFLNLYQESSSSHTVSVTGCTFNNTGEASKAALNVKATADTMPEATLLAYSVTISNCTTSGNFPTAETSKASRYINELVQVDKIQPDRVSDIKIDVDGQRVYSSLEPVVTTDEHGYIQASVPVGNFTTNATAPVTVAPVGSTSDGSVASVTFDAEAVKVIAAAAVGSSVLTLKVDDTSTAVRKTVDISLVDKNGNSVFTESTAGKATVTIPFDLAAGEGINVYYVDGDNKTLVSDAGATCNYEKKTVTFTLSHFSVYELKTTISVDERSQEVYKVSDGFYQADETYQTSTNFYITNAGGLKYFRDLVSACDNGTVASGYVNTWVAGSGTTYDWYTGGVFTSRMVHLLANIDLRNEDWTPIGYVNTTYTNSGKEVKTYFYGSFDGHSHTISNLKIVGNESNTFKGGYGAYGLFGFIGSSSTTPQVFSNLTIDTVEAVSGNTTTYDYVGAFVGNAGSNAVTFNNCHVTGKIALNASYQVGSIYGIGAGSLTNCTVKGDTGSTITNPNHEAGGLAGCTRASVTISNCSVKGVKIDAIYAGGLVGLNNNNTTFTNNSVSNAVINGDKNADIDYGSPARTSETPASTTTSDNVTITVSIAQTNDVKYTSLQAALDAASDDDTVTLLRSTTEVATISSGKSVTLDLAGYTLSGPSGASASTITNEGTLTVKDSKSPQGAIACSTSDKAALENKGAATIESGTFAATDGANDLLVSGGTAKVNGGLFTATSANNVVTSVASGSTGEVVVNGGLMRVLASDGKAIGSSKSNIVAADGTSGAAVTLNGGYFTSNVTQESYDSTAKNELKYADGKTLRRVVGIGSFELYGVGLSGTYTPAESLAAYVATTTKTFTYSGAEQTITPSDFKLEASGKVLGTDNYVILLISSSRIRFAEGDGPRRWPSSGSDTGFN